MSRPIVVIVCMDAPPNRGSFNSAHIFGTHVPVEEPSTASIADSCTAANDACDVLFDHLVSAREQHRRHGEAERLGGVFWPALAYLEPPGLDAVPVFRSP